MTEKRKPKYTTTKYSKNTSSTSFAKTQSTAAPMEWYQPENEDIEARKKYDLSRIGNTTSIEKAVHVFPDVLPFWINCEGSLCEDYPEAEEIFKAVQTQWDLLRRKSKYRHVRPLPQDMDKALSLMVDVQQILDKDGKLPEKWPTGKLNLMKAKIIIKHFKVSLVTLRRHVKKGVLTDYRETPHAKNAELILDATEVAKNFPRRPKSQ